MTGDMLQHALVTLIALLAMIVIVRRVAGFVGVRAKQKQCSCPSSKGACGGSVQPTASAASQPLIMLKPSAITPKNRF